ncbi:MAG: terminase family protein [Acidimicrobiia bacterium]|nr:terminase family protein [Acidimicrobiia bacterium]
MMMSEISSRSDIEKAHLRRLLWREIARRDQVVPDGEWRVWLCLGGRGSGKTRAAAEALCDLIIHSGSSDGDWAVIAPTFGDARDTCVEGPSGLLRTLQGLIRPGRSGWNRSQGQLHLVTGATVFCDGADDGAYRMQGKNLRGAWCDEIGLWKRGGASGRPGREWWEVAWDESLRLAVRIAPAKIIATGTPKRGHPLVKRLLGDDRVPSTRLRTADNVINLDPGWYRDLLDDFEGTAVESQELEGHFLENVEGALWQQRVIDSFRWNHREWDEPALSRVVVGVDPSGGTSSASAETGIVASGIVRRACPCGTRPNQPHYAVIADCSIKDEASARARRIVECFHEHQADKVVGERNYGGDNIPALVAQVATDDRVPYEMVTAAKGKMVRAGPVVAAYEQGRVHHVGVFNRLEEQMTTFVPDTGARSPDRLDALVFSLASLLKRSSHRVRYGRHVGRLPDRIG